MEVLETPIGSYEIHEKYIVARYVGDINIGFEEAESIISILKQNFTGDFGWISDRVNSYSFDTTLIPHVLSQVDNLKFVAAVVHGVEMKKTGYFDDVFFSPEGIGMREFDTLEEAENWIKMALTRNDN